MEDKSKDFKMKKFNLKNQFALITGASGLLGYEHAKALLEVNANVIITDIKMKTLEKNLKKLKKSYPLKNIIKQRLDVTKESSVLRCKRYLDKKGIFVILPNGQAVRNLDSWRIGRSKIEPGSTIIVPRDSTPFNAISIFRIFTPILANFATAAAAISALNN